MLARARSPDRSVHADFIEGAICRRRGAQLAVHARGSDLQTVSTLRLDLCTINCIRGSPGVPDDEPFCNKEFEIPRDYVHDSRVPRLFSSGSRGLVRRILLPNTFTSTRDQVLARPHAGNQ